MVAQIIIVVAEAAIVGGGCRGWVVSFFAAMVVHVGIFCASIAAVWVVVIVDVLEEEVALFFSLRVAIAARSVV